MVCHNIELQTNGNIEEKSMKTFISILERERNHHIAACEEELSSAETITTRDILARRSLYN